VQEEAVGMAAEQEEGTLDWGRDAERGTSPTPAQTQTQTQTQQPAAASPAEAESALLRLRFLQQVGARVPSATLYSVR
jgi:hypothetical protein